MAKKQASTAEPVEEVPEAEQGSGRIFQIKHIGVSGPIVAFKQDELVYESDLQFNEDVDIDRLLRLGAIEEVDPDAAGPVVMEHPENQPFVDGTGRVVDAPGFDRPTIQHDVRVGNVKAQSASERLAAIEGQRTVTAGGRSFRLDPAARSPEAIEEQQNVQRNLRAGGTVSPEEATAAAEGDYETAEQIHQDSLDEALQQEVPTDPTTGEEIPEEARRATPKKVTRRKAAAE